MGVSENSVPLKPMVLLIIIPMKNGYFIGNILYFQTNPYEFSAQDGTQDELVTGKAYASWPRGILPRCV